jgi:hypothetical protein
MSDRTKPSYSELAHQIVRDAAAPLPFPEILRGVDAIRPIETKNPTATIRNAISQSRLVVSTGDGRYGWKPRMIVGSRLRLTLSARDFEGSALQLGDEHREALYPAFFAATRKYDDRGPVTMVFPDGASEALALIYLDRARWGLTGPPAFWGWLRAQAPVSGDHLILEVLDGEQRRYGLRFAPRAARDEAAIAARNQEVIDASVAYVRSRWRGTMISELCEFLLARGHYQHLLPPDPLLEIWTPEIWQPLVEELDMGSAWVLSADPEAQMTPLRTPARAPDAPVVDNLISEVFSRLGLTQPFQAVAAPRKRAGRSTSRPDQERVTVWTLRVSYQERPTVWREIELRGDQTLDDLHEAIQQAYGWANDHLYAFFLSGRPYDRRTEIGHPWSDAPRLANEVSLGSLRLKLGQSFLYLFDFGDDHQFHIEVFGQALVAPRGRYPRVVGKQGRAPRQYR